MRPSLRSDFKRLRDLAFKSVEKRGSVLRRLSRLHRRVNALHNAADIWNVYSWLLVPFSLWPIDIQGLAGHIATELENNRELDNSLNVLLAILDRVPKQKTQTIIQQFEHCIQSGDYRSLLLHPEKFDEHEDELQYDQELANAWATITRLFKPQNYANSDGVIRRTMSQERNFRKGWEFTWHRKKKQFRIVFDAMCHRWKLFGTRHGKPLLLMATVNPTAHGTMIIIPRHLSLAPTKDLNWSLISKIHNAHCPPRQGPKFSRGRMAKRAAALQAQALWNECEKKGLRGDQRYYFICAEMKRVPTPDKTWLKDLRALAKKLSRSSAEKQSRPIRSVPRNKIAFIAPPSTRSLISAR